MGSFVEQLEGEGGKAELDVGAGEGCSNESVDVEAVFEGQSVEGGGGWGQSEGGGGAEGEGEGEVRGAEAVAEQEAEMVEGGVGEGG